MKKQAIATTLTDLSEELTSLEVARAEIDQDISRVKAAIRALKVYLNNDSIVEAPPPNAGARKNAARRNGRALSTSNAVRQLARSMMIERGRPVTRAEITRAAMAAGVSFGGNTPPEKTVSKILTRGEPPEFQSAGHGKGYWPSDLPLAED